MHDFAEEVLKQYDALSSKLAQKEKRIKELEDIVADVRKFANDILDPTIPPTRNERYCKDCWLEIDFALSEKSDKTPKGDCKYPDWEGNIIVGKHSYDTDGVCNICGEQPEEDE